jgi:hypothetical protein
MTESGQDQKRREFSILVWGLSNDIIIQVTVWFRFFWQPDSLLWFCDGEVGQRHVRQKPDDN